MNYSEIIQEFWKDGEKTSMGSSAIVIYFYLLNHRYESALKVIKISDQKIYTNLGLHRDTVHKGREKLKRFGLISFEISNGKPCEYEFSFDKINGLPDLPKKQNSPKEVKKKNIVKPKAEINVIVNEGKTEEIEKQVSQATIHFNEILLTNKNIPTYDEFLKFAKTLDNYSNEIESDVKNKYDKWLSNKWQNNTGRPITNWKALLKNKIRESEKSDENGNVKLPNIIPTKLSKD